MRRAIKGARTTCEIFDKTTPALKITHDKLSEISADAWKDVPQYLNTKHTDKIQIKQDPVYAVLTFDDPFQQRTVGKPSDCMDKRTAAPAPKANELADLLRRNDIEQLVVDTLRCLGGFPKLLEFENVLELGDEKYTLPDLAIFGFQSAVK